MWHQVVERAVCLAFTDTEGGVCGIEWEGGRCVWHRVVGKAVCVWHRVVGRAMCLVFTDSEGDARTLV